jgi:hypothetical protein
MGWNNICFYDFGKKNPPRGLATWREFGVVFLMLQVAARLKERTEVWVAFAADTLKCLGLVRPAEVDSGGHRFF